ncbi:MAG: hypothetical protein R3F07_03740 [Opitutaceae bacterium]
MKISFPNRWLLILVPFLSGCQDKQVVFYEVPKENHAPARTTAPMAPAMSGPSELTWEKPESWLEKPASAFRKGSYAAGDNASGEVDISISTFPDAAGGLLANINRWRGQVDLDPIGEMELSDETTPVEIAGIPGIRIDIVEPLPADGDPTASNRIVGAVVTMGGSAWFFKMSGPSAAVEREIPSFDTLLQSVKPANPSSMIPSMPSAGIGGAMATQADAIPAPPAPDPFRFQAPPNWVRQPPAPLRVASFLISGDSVPDADFSVIALPGMAGGDLANVNRWRGQISLPAISEAQLRQAAQHIDSGSYHFDLYDMVSDSGILEGGHKARILAAIFKQGDTSWFFKMTGEDQLVAGEKASFIEFLKSFQLEEEK